jgi:hypothetical protein
MEEASKASPTLALSILMDELIPILEKHVPVKKVKKKSRNRLERKRNVMWRRLTKVKGRIKTANSIHKLTKLLQDKAELLCCQ